MYNTVGETAGVTQDVGSDPTVRESPGCWFFDVVCGEGLEGAEGEGEGWCCTFCGREVCDEDVDCEMEMGEKEEKVKEVRGGMIDLAEMSRLEDEDVEMDEEVEASSQVEQRLGDDDDAGRPRAQDILT